jgi:hypothetical protein
MAPVLNVDRELEVWSGPLYHVVLVELGLHVFGTRVADCGLGRL